MSGLDPEHRRHVLEAVAVWLDELAEAEPPLPGVAPRPCSLLNLSPTCLPCWASSPR